MLVNGNVFQFANKIKSTIIPHNIVKNCVNKAKNIIVQ